MKELQRWVQMLVLHKLSRLVLYITLPVFSVHRLLHRAYVYLDDQFWRIYNEGEQQEG